jgi:hypothetical protein
VADALARLRANRAARVAADLPTTRTCGACDVCCTAPGIKEMNKPPGVPCAHLAGPPGASCGIYASRPKPCFIFHCLWRMSDMILPDYLHPARCGFMLAFNNPMEWPSVVTVHVDPARPDAWKTPWAQTVFATLAEQWNCLVAIGQVPLTSYLFCPNGTRLSVLDNPTLMKTDRGTVGAPSYVFGPDRRPLAERVFSVHFTWALPPPPEE